MSIDIQTYAEVLVKNVVDDKTDATITEQTDKTYRQITVGGERPFVALCKVYLKSLLTELEHCIRILNTKPGMTHIHVHFNLKKQYMMTCDDGTVKIYTADVPHYGPRMKFYGNEVLDDKKIIGKIKKPWTSRDYTIWEHCNISPPFRTAQIEMLNRGYYLIDISDNRLSYDTKFLLYKTDPPAPTGLWHYFDKIPGFDKKFGRVY
jgi:hypothetical protein